MTACCICGENAFTAATPPYRRCGRCGHEERTSDTASQSLMLNEPLRAVAVQRTSSLDDFQARVVARLRWNRPHGTLVDIGSSAGRFLLRQRVHFRRVVGVEVTPEAVAFSRREFGLEVVTDLAEVRGPIDVATAWHSLEHIPAAALRALVPALAARLASDGTVIVSVPNAASWQNHWFGRHYAFRDVANHPHQFTPDSLDRLFAAHGWQRTRTVVSWPYNRFGYAQALLNAVAGGHNYLYYRLKRGQPRASVGRDLLHFGLAPLAAIAGVLLALLDALRPERQGVLTCAFEKRPSPL